MGNLNDGMGAAHVWVVVGSVCKELLSRIGAVVAVLRGTAP